jgi:hypothetical protein
MMSITSDCSMDIETIVPRQAVVNGVTFHNRAGGIENQFCPISGFRPELSTLGNYRLNCGTLYEA